jgi:hypothetical protein
MVVAVTGRIAPGTRGTTTSGGGRVSGARALGAHAASTTTTASGIDEVRGTRSAYEVGAQMGTITKSCSR